MIIAHTLLLSVGAIFFMLKKIQFRKVDHELFLAFWKQLEHKFTRVKNVVIENTDEEIIISFELVSSNSKLYTKLIKLWLADALVVYYKEKFFASHMKLRGLNEVSFKLVTKALAIFDKAQDVSYVLDRFGLDNKLINVHSFYIFKMGELRLKWKEICELFTANLSSVNKSDVFFELIKYLILITESERKIVKLSFRGDEILVLDENDIDLIEPTKADEGNFINILLGLISLAPQTISINLSEKNPSEFISVVENLFAGKVRYST